MKEPSPARRAASCGVYVKPTPCLPWRKTLIVPWCCAPARMANKPAPPWWIAAWHKPFLVKDWISCLKAGRIARYTITAAGKAALRRLLDEDRRRRQAALGFAEAATPFQAQHAVWGVARVTEGGKSRKLRVNLAESPLVALGRRKGPDGQPFLSPALVQAGEKLREDFERAQMGPRVGQNWDRFLTGGDRGGFLNDSGLAEGPRAARARVSDALDDLGPGLADVVLRVCCFLEGLESAEKRLGWSARSGKIVLKIGLQRLLAHYAQTHGFVPALRE